MIVNLEKRLFAGAGLVSAMLVALSLAPAACAQGLLTVTPNRSVTTAAGNGSLGYTGDSGAASAATLADPSAVAYDANGNLYLADGRNHVVRQVSAAGAMTTLAGNGIEGYGGDGAAATSAYLDTPTGVAVDATGNVYIADSHNHRIRKVSGGIITTIAGTSTAGFSGDGAAATAAQLWLPSAVAVDGNGNVYIADTNNQRIRKITGTAITTIAGNGEELFSGDGEAATSAVLDSPTGVAVGASGNVYIADRHNQRVRRIAAAGGTISTIAGSGAPSFAGGFSGDGATANTATLARPSGVAVDAAGNVYIADTGNQRIRQVGGGAIATVVGSGQQGYGGDGTAPASVNLNSPKAVAADALGNLAISDQGNQRVRVDTLPSLLFASDNVGVLSAPLSVTLANTGSAPLAVSTTNFSGPFTAVPGGSCPASTVTLAPGASCTENIAFWPVAVGGASGSVSFGGTGVVPQSIRLAGAAVQTVTTVTLNSSLASPLVGEAVTLTATVQLPGAGTPTGTVSFYDGTTLIGTPQTLIAGSAWISTTALSVGTHTITAAYSGDPNFIAATSPALSQSVIDFGFTIASGTGTGIGSGTGGSGSGSSPITQTVAPGQPAIYAFTVLPVGGVIFPFPVTLSATGLPPGATVSFSPKVLVFTASGATFTMTIQTSASAALHPGNPFGRALGGSSIALGLLLLPFSGRIRRQARHLRLLSMCAALILSLAAIGGLSGCGTGSGFFGQAPQTYNVNVIGTAAGTTTSLQRFATVSLTVQ